MREKGNSTIYPPSFLVSHSLFALLHTHIHTHTSQARLADGRLVKDGRRGPDVAEPTLQKAKAFDLPHHRGTTVGEERILTGPLKRVK